MVALLPQSRMPTHIQREGGLCHSMGEEQDSGEACNTASVGIAIFGKYVCPNVHHVISYQHSHKPFIVPPTIRSAWCVPSLRCVPRAFDSWERFGLLQTPRSQPLPSSALRGLSLLWDQYIPAASPEAAHTDSVHCWPLVFGHSAVSVGWAELFERTPTLTPCWFI